MSRRRLFSAAVAGFGAVALLATTAPASRAGSARDLPNLQVRPAFDVFAAQADFRTGSRAVRFATASDNVGDHPFELLGAPPRDATRTAAQQCVRFAARVCTERLDVGDFTFHAAHGHWHLDGYAKYELRRLGPGNAPDMSPGGLVAGGQKVSFCLLDYERSDGSGGDMDPLIFGFYVGCSGVLQGISPGWADTYEAFLEGQQIVIDGVADGEYAIVITIDPDGMIQETSKADNTSVRRIRIANGGRTATALP